VEAANANLQACLSKKPGEIHRARKLIRLNPYQRDQALPTLQFFSNAIWPNSGIRLIESRNSDLHILAEYLAALTI
jgi:hypothetical protein